jgi:ubiquitin carboxyl-terminal hydrolase 10
MAGVSVKSAKLVYYKLHGVLYHHGESAGGGHYAVDVLHQSGDSKDRKAWLHVDDETVRVVQHEDVFGDLENERIDNQCAYMQFYCRTAPTWT